MDIDSSFCGQIRWAKWSLERAQVKAGLGEAGRPLDHGDVLGHQLSHFVNTLHQFVMDRLLHGAWLELQRVGIAYSGFPCAWSAFTCMSNHANMALHTLVWFHVHDVDLPA